MARPLQFRNQLSVRLSRLLVLQLSRELPFRQVRIDLILVPQINASAPCTCSRVNAG